MNKRSQRGRPPASQAFRPPLERMVRIHELVAQGRYPNASTLAREFEVSTKTIHRDIWFMRDRLSLPLAYDGSRFGFRYTAPVRTFPTLQITEGELLALVIAEKAAKQYRGTSFEKPLLRALKKIERSLPETFSLSLADVQQTISFRTSAEPILDLGLFDQLTRATARRQQLELTYRKPGQQQPEQRVIDPYHLANINGEWYLFAYDHLRKDIRTFVPSRMQSIRPTGKTFSPPKKFSLEERLRGSFGVHSAEGEYQVRIRFSARVADYIREKKWHKSQQLAETSTGELEVALRLSSLREVERWVLSWGGDAVVLQPQELADSVKEAARRLLQSYRGNLA